MNGGQRWTALDKGCSEGEDLVSSDCGFKMAQKNTAGR